MKNPPFNSLVWGSLRLTPITQDAALKNTCGRGTGNKYIISHGLTIDYRPTEKGLEMRQIYLVSDVTTRYKSALRCCPSCTAYIEVLQTREAMYQANNAPKALF